jgi:hypothetical protein
MLGSSPVDLLEEFENRKTKNSAQFATVSNITKLEKKKPWKEAGIFRSHVRKILFIPFKLISI